MKKPFQVGDRVRVYEGTETFVGPVDTLGNFQGRDYVRLKIEGRITREFHPKQCRRLVKKPRKRIWVVWPKYHFNAREGVLWLEKPRYSLSEEDCVEFIEVRRK